MRHKNRKQWITEQKQGEEFLNIQHNRVVQRKRTSYMLQKFLKLCDVTGCKWAVGFVVAYSCDKFSVLHKIEDALVRLFSRALIGQRYHKKCSNSRTAFCLELRPFFCCTTSNPASILGLLLWKASPHCYGCDGGLAHLCKTPPATCKLFSPALHPLKSPIFAPSSLTFPTKTIQILTIESRERSLKGIHISQGWNCYVTQLTF